MKRLEASSSSTGKSKEPRKLVLSFGETPPATKGHEIPVWVRDGWGESESTVVNDARAAGADSPIVYAFVSPRPVLTT